MIRAIKFLGIPVSDQKRSLKFYTEKLGFIVAADRPLPGGQRWIELRIPGGDTRLVLFAPPGDKPGRFINMAFSTDDVDETYRELSEKGVEFTGPPTHERWGSYVVFRDPDGNQLTIGTR